MTDVSADHDRAPARSWSVSQSHILAECPRQWWFRYVAAARPAQPRAVKQIIGSAIHAGLEAAYRAVQAGKAIPVSRGGFRHARGAPLAATAGLAALAAFSAYWDANGAGVREYEREDAERLLLELLEALITPHAGEILGVEEKFTLRTMPQDEVPPTRVVGVMDLVLNTTNEMDKSIHIRDWKLGPVPTDPAELENNVQLCTYVAAATYRWPWAKRIAVGLYSIRERREIVTALHPDSVEHAARQLSYDAETARLREERKWVEPTPGEHCGGCRFRSYCPAMNKTKPPVVSGVDVAAERARLAQLLH
jgi:CRISPR/Cas system-associated exonuclease Cas4 (RecB family)